MNRLALRLAPVGILAVVLAACSTAASPSASMGDMASDAPDTPMASDNHAGFAWGEPAEAADADRVIEVAMLDELSFDPAAIEVAVGETVTFSVTNAGQLPHDFTLGDEETQDEHDAEMAEAGMSGMGHDEPNALTLEGGESGELTWTFTAPASILFGCHVPGHYDAGMVGTLTIAGS